MANTKRAVRRALMLLLSISGAASPFTVIATATADESSLAQAMMLPEFDTAGQVVPVRYSSALWANNLADQAAEEGTPDENVGQSNADDDSADDDDADQDDKYAALSKQFAELEKKLEKIEGAVDDVAGDKSIVHSGSSNSTMKISGRVHADAWGFDTEDDPAPSFMDGGDPQNRLGFRRLRFGVSGKVKDNMLYKIEAEFAGGSNVEFRDAYLGWTDLPVLRTVLLGNQKRPYGLDHLNSSRYNVFMERPFVIEAINQDARRLGLASYGVSENQRWNWRYGVYNQRNVQSLGNYIDDHLQLEVTGRLANTIWYDEVSGGRGYAHWAISGSHADSTTNATNEARFRTRPEARSSARWIDTGRIDGADYFDLMGLEGVVNVGRVQVVGEYQSLWQSRDQGFNDTRFDGGYVYASYFLTGEHMPWDRESGTLGRVKPFQNFWLVDKCDGCRDAGWGAWQVAVRYSHADFNDEDILGGVGDSWTFGMNWHWNANARMQFNYIAGEIEDRDAGSGPESGRYNIFGTRFMIDF
ncbi:Phosphate-selective porin O and P [Rubripirellula lacrimiformis]|uniref:Phosphate-selective porin O and P n=1 Tax=Rubripirellula lacrimiformis TaxID=1930273 RepID=A0A517NAA1_9BACT|nr:porin [Rubripirellula lacrimiformis]QDT04061.1 Phosphate-selective porin O and P [Rubripirellula lacrimiformis]